ncbi:flagellar protein FlgN [bacterium]|nr:flagellar protein FlgN [bacterium]
MKRLEELLDLLTEEEQRFNRLFALKLSERTALAAGDTFAIEAGTRSMERVAREIDELETDRIALTHALAAEYGVPAEELTLSRLAELTGAYYREPLLSAAARLADILHRLELQNRQNAMVLRENLAVLNEAVLSLAESGERGLEAYTPMGAAPARPLVAARLLDQRA